MKEFMEQNRFIRQTKLSEIGDSGQSELEGARVLCVGLGGLGSPVSLYLTAAGVGTLGLIDPDTVDLSNLQRQVLFSTSDQGHYKVHCAKKKLLELNPGTKIEVYNESLSTRNVEQLFRQYDLIIDGSDNFSTKFLVNDAAFKCQVPFIYGSVNQFEGQVALFQNKSGSACYRCLHPFPPKAQIRNCVDAGVLGSVVGVVGTMQATLALETLISRGDPNHPLCPQAGVLTVVDLKGSWDFRALRIPQNPHCLVCSRPANEIQLSETKGDICEVGKPSIEPQDLEQLMATSQNRLFLIDVRDQDEWDCGHLKDARHFSLKQIVNGEFPKIPTHVDKVVVYCQSGIRSARAIELFQKNGLTHSFFNLRGGLQAWRGTLLKS